MFIAEIGINHQGDINIAKQLIDVAVDCGVDVVKFQKRNPDVCVPENQKHIVKDTVFGRMEYIQYKHLIEFGKKEYDEIDDYCHKRAILWTASVWDLDSLEFINNYNVPFIKLPSACLTDWDLLNALRSGSKDVIISTGMSKEDEIISATNILKNHLVGILHCNSSYPSVNSELNLNYLKTLRSMFPIYDIGYSGHEVGYLPTVLAKTLGAKIIERHITLDKNMVGSDHKASLNPQELKELIQQLKEVEIILGQDKKIVYDSELKIKEKLRR